MKILRILCLAALLPGMAQALESGDTLRPWTLLDQFDQPYTLGDDTRVLLVAADMAAAGLVKQAFGDAPAQTLAQHRAAFLADISRMPGPIATLFAIPAMRDYPYRVLLDRQARVVPRYPVEAGKVLWLGLDGGRVTVLRQFDDAAALRAALVDSAP